MRIEVVVVPVSDVDVAKSFYADQLSFSVDHDTTFPDNMRVVQLTPPGSACSIQIGQGITDRPPGSSSGIALVVSDMAPAHAQLVANRVPISDISLMGGFNMAFFSDPDGNPWILQEIPRSDSSMHE